MTILWDDQTSTTPTPATPASGVKWDDANEAASPPAAPYNPLLEAFARGRNAPANNQGFLQAQDTAAMNAFVKANADIAKGVGLDKLIPGGLTGSDAAVDLAAPVDPSRNTAVARAVGGSAPLVAASLLNPLAGGAVGAAQGVGSAREEGASQGYTPGQTAGLAAERGIFNAVLGMIPGGKVAGATASEFFKTAAKVYGINVGQAFFENHLKDDLGIKTEKDWEALKSAAASGDNIAQSLLFASVHHVASMMADRSPVREESPSARPKLSEQPSTSPPPEVPAGNNANAVPPAESPSPAARAEESATGGGAAGNTGAPEVLTPEQQIQQGISDLDTMNTRAQQLLAQRSAVPGSLESPYGQIEEGIPAEGEDGGYAPLAPTEQQEAIRRARSEREGVQRYDLTGTQLEARGGVEGSETTSQPSEASNVAPRAESGVSAPSGSTEGGQISGEATQSDAIAKGEAAAKRLGVKFLGVDDPAASDPDLAGVPPAMMFQDEKSGNFNVPLGGDVDKALATKRAAFARAGGNGGLGRPKEVSDAVQQRGAASEVSRVAQTGEDRSEGGGGVRQGERGLEAAGAASSEKAGPGAASVNDPNFSKRPPTLAEQRAEAKGARAGEKVGRKFGIAEERNRQASEPATTTVPLSEAIKARMKAEDRAFVEGQKNERRQQQITEALEEKRIPISEAIKASMTIRAQAEDAVAKMKGKAELAQDVKDQLTESAKSLPRDIRAQFITDVRDARTTTDLYRSLKSMDEAVTAYNHKQAVSGLFDRIGSPEKAPAQNAPNTTLQKHINNITGVSNKPETPFARSVDPEKMRPEFRDGVAPLVDSLRKDGVAKGAAGLSALIQEQTDNGRSNAFSDAELAQLKGLEGKTISKMSADDVKLVDNAIRHVQHLSDTATKMNFAGKQHDREQVKNQIVDDIRQWNPEPLKSSAVGQMLGHAESNGEKGIVRRAFGQAQRDGLRTLSLAGGGEEGNLAKVGYFDLADGETRALGLKQQGADAIKAVQEKYDVSDADLVRMTTKAEKIDLPNGRSIEMTPAERMSFANHWTDADTQKEMQHAGMVLKRFKGNVFKKTAVTPDVAKAIIDSMTPFERDYASAMKDFVNGPLRDAGNKASVDNDGFERLTSTDHWSRSRDDAGEQKNVTADQKGFYRAWLENLGMLKAREGSKSPVVVGNVLEEYNRNVDGIARYANLSGPVRNMLMLMGDPELGQEMRSRLGQKWMDAVTQRLQTVSGMGAEPSPLLSLSNKIRANIAAGSLGFRASSVLKHLLGGTMAASDFEGRQVRDYLSNVVNPVNMFDGTTKQEMMDASPYFRDRWERSPADLESPTTDSQHLAKTPLGQKAKAVQDLSMKGLTWGDARDGVQIYKAWQDVYRAEHPNASDAEVKQWAIKKAEYTVRKTGTTSSPLDESNIALSLKNVPFANFATLFSSKLNKIHNIADEAIQNYRQVPNAENASKLGKAALLVGFNAATAATTSYLFARWRQGVQPQNDKDGQATKANALWAAIEELADNVTLGGGDAVREGRGIVNGRPQDGNAITNTVDESGAAMMKAYKGFGKGDYREGAEQSIKSITKAMKLAGVPLDAPQEYAQGAVNAAAGEAKPESASRERAKR